MRRRIEVSRSSLRCAWDVAHSLAGAYNLKNQARPVQDSRGGYYMFSSWRQKEYDAIYTDAYALCGNGKTVDGYFYSVKDSKDYVLAFEMLVEKYKLEKYIELK